MGKRAAYCVRKMEKRALVGEYGKLIWCKGKIRRWTGVIRRWERALRKEDGKERWCKGIKGGGWDNKKMEKIALFGRREREQCWGVWGLSNMLALWLYGNSYGVCLPLI